MTAMSCQQLAEVADELALDVLPGDLRALALEHLDECHSCRAMVEELSETADALLLAHGGTEPPAGFEERVLARIAAEPTGLRRTRRRPPLLAAAAAIVVAALVGVGALALRPGSDRSAGDELSERHVQLISVTGGPVGDVSAYPGRPAWFFMRVDRGVTPGTYECVLDVSGGRTVHVGSLTVTEGKGAWGQALTIPPSNVRDARLVAPDGSTVATATFH